MRRLTVGLLPPHPLLFSFGAHRLFVCVTALPEAVGLLPRTVDALFASHRPINTTALKEWGTVLLHKIHLDIDLTPDEAAAFIKVQGKILISPALSEGQVNNWLVKQVLALAGAAPHQINAFKATWLARYEAALAVHPLLKDEAAGWTPRQRTLVASNFFDSLMFAGGISVPTVLGLVLAVAANPGAARGPYPYRRADAERARSGCAPQDR